VAFPDKCPHLLGSWQNLSPVACNSACQLGLIGGRGEAAHFASPPLRLADSLVGASGQPVVGKRSS
jgi:hypothetical protein